MRTHPDPGLRDGVLSRDVRFGQVVGGLVSRHVANLGGQAPLVTTLGQTEEMDDEVPVDPQGGPWPWTVTWGQVGRGDLRMVEVWAYDAEEAMVEGAALRPQWHRPRTAFLRRRDHPWTSPSAGTSPSGGAANP